MPAETGDVACRCADEGPRKLGEGELGVKEVHCPFVCYGEALGGLGAGGVGAEVEGVAWWDVVDVEREEGEEDCCWAGGKVV